MQPDIYLYAILLSLGIALRVAVAVRRYNILIPRKSIAPSIICVIGPFFSGKSELIDSLQLKLKNSSRPFISTSWWDFASRVHFPILPSVKGSESSGDPMFDMWTVSSQPDGSVNIHLTERGCIWTRALHDSWATLARGGVNLLVEYPTVDNWSMTDLFRSFKSFKHRVVLIELRPPLSNIRFQESKGEVDLRFPVGSGISTFKVSRNLPPIPECFKRISVDIEQGQAMGDVIEKCYRLVARTGIV